MKVWQAIFSIILLVIIFVLGFDYIKLSNEFDNLNVENNKLAEEYSSLEKNYENNKFFSKEKSKENIENDIFYEVVKNNAKNYITFDYSKTTEENIRNYISILATTGAMLGPNIPEFSDCNQLEESFLKQILLKIKMLHSEANLYADYPGIIIHKDFVENSLKDIFGDQYDINKLDFEKLSLYPLNEYEDIYVISEIGEFSELQDGRYVIVDTKEKDENYEVTIIEYFLCDDEFVLEDGENTNRILLNNKGDKVKEYKIEAVKTSDDCMDIRMTDNNKEITYQDVEKYVLSNKEKFEQKKITFNKANSKLNVVSCEVVNKR